LPVVVLVRLNRRFIGRKVMKKSWVNQLLFSLMVITFTGISNFTSSAIAAELVVWESAPEADLVAYLSIGGAGENEIPSEFTFRIENMTEDVEYSFTLPEDLNRLVSIRYLNELGELVDDSHEEVSIDSFDHHEPNFIAKSLPPGQSFSFTTSTADSKIGIDWDQFNLVRILVISRIPFEKAGEEHLSQNLENMVRIRYISDPINLGSN